MPVYDDVYGGLPPIQIPLPPLDPDPSTLRWPWDAPPPDAAAAAPTSAQPAPQPILGPPTESDALAAVPMPAPPSVDSPPVPLPAIDEPAPVHPFGSPESSPAFGPQPGNALLSALPDFTISTEHRPIADEQHNALLAADPLALKDRGDLPPALAAAGGTGLPAGPAFSDEEAGRMIASLPPEKQAEIQAKFDAAKAQDLATRTLEISTQNNIAAQENAAAYKRALELAQQKQEQLEAEAKELAATHIDPGGGLSKGQRVAGILAAMVGGLVAGRTGGPNEGLAMLNHAIDRGIDAQKADLANRRGLLSQRQSAVGEMFARTGDMYRATETARVATWESAIGELQAEQQKYDPHGTTSLRIAAAITGAKAQQAAAANTYGQQRFKDTIEFEKARQEALKTAEVERHNRATEAEAAAKLAAKGGAGIGVGSATNTKFTVPTGFFDPFDSTPDRPGTPVMAARQIGGKGEDPKERNELQVHLDMYKHVNDGLAKLRAIAEEIGGGGKGVGESVWKARKTTLAAEYDATREGLTSYMTKAIGDRPTQGQLELQAHRIPERASVFEARDPGRLLQAQQEEADSALAADLGVIGVNAAPIIKHAQDMRALTPAPNARDAIGAAQQALSTARTPEDIKNAKASLDAAKAQAIEEDANNAANQAAVLHAEHAGGHHALPLDGIPAPSPGDTESLFATVKAHNEATDTYNQSAAKYHSMAAQPLAVKSKLKGDVDKAQADREQALAVQARRVATARKSVDSSLDDVVASIGRTVGQPGFGGLSPDRLQAIARVLDLTKPPMNSAGDINAQVAAGSFAAQAQRKIDHATTYQRHKIIDAFFGAR